MHVIFSRVGGIVNMDFMADWRLLDVLTVTHQVAGLSISLIGDASVLLSLGSNGYNPGTINLHAARCITHGL